MTHRNWLCGVVLRREAVRDLYSSSCKGFSPAHRGRQFRFVLLGIVFSFFWLAVVPPEESFSLHLSRESVNGIWRVRRSIEQVVQCFVSWSGGDGDGGGEEDTGVASPSLLGICGQGGIQLMVITSSLLSSRCPPPSSHLCLIVSISPHAVFNPISPFSYSFPPPSIIFAYSPLWCEMNWEESRSHFCL